MAQKSRDAATMPRESNNEVQQQQQHRRHFPPEIETRTSSGRRPEDDGRDNKIVNGSRPLPGANKPMTVTAAKTSAANHDHEASPRSAQLRVVINRFGLLELDLSDRNLRSIPDAVFALSRLEVLRLSRNRLRSMPNTVSGLRHLRHLDVGNNEMDELPVALAACSRLVELDVRSNKLTSIPATLPSGLSRHLRALRLAGNRIDQLPDDFGRLGALRLVDLSCNRLRDLPPSFGDLRELNVLILSDNGFDRLPVGVCRLTNLETLDLNKNQLSDLPDNFDRLRRLRELRLAANRFDSIPDSVARTYGLIVLDVSDNAVTSLPAGLATMPRLVELDARRNAIDRFPEVNTGWPCLERLNVSGNRLRTLPVGAMTRLRRLDADRNWLTDVPHGIHRLASTLELLSLAGNRITHLSADLALLKRLRVLDVSDNALRSIPKAVEQMPGLETFDVTGNDLEPRDAVGGPRGGRVLNGHPVAYVVDGLSGPPPPGAVPLVFTQTPSGLLYATPAAAVPLIGHMNGRTAAVRRPVAGAASGAPHASGLVTSRNKSSGGSGVLGLFRKKKNGGGNGHDSGGSVGNSSDKRLGLNAGTQTARDVDAGGHFQFPTASSDMMSPSTFSGANGSSGGVAVGANRPPPSFGGHRPDWNGWPSTVNGRGLDSVSREAIHSTARSMSIGDLHELESFATVGTVAERTATSERRLKQPRWKSTMDVTKSYGDDHPSAFRSPVADHRRRSVSGDSDGDDGRFSDTVTVNDEVGDRLSLGEDDFEFLPPNVHDAKLMRIADDLETMLNEQLLDPIIDGHQANGLSSGQHRAANQPAVGVGLRPVLQTTTSRVNGTRGNSSNIFSGSPPNWRKHALGSSVVADATKPLAKKGGGGIESAASTVRPNAGAMPRSRQRPEIVGNVNPNNKKSIISSTVDTFLVGPSGGLFRSSSNPAVSVYIPSDAVIAAITLHMQVFTIPADLLTDQNIIAVGDIVILRDVTSGSETTAVESSVRQHATVTVPTPHVVIGGSRGMIHGSTKLHVLTYRGGSGTTAHNDRSGDLPNTCLPCAYDYTTARKGIISIRAWHFTGLGAVLTKGGNPFSACRSMETLLRRLNDVASADAKAI